MSAPQLARVGGGSNGACSKCGMGICCAKHHVCDIDSKLSDDEMHLMAALLQRYCRTELDMFEHWAVATPDGLAYIDLSVKPSGDDYVQIGAE